MAFARLLVSLTTLLLTVFAGDEGADTDGGIQIYYEVDLDVIISNVSYYDIKNYFLNDNVTTDETYSYYLYKTLDKATNFSDTDSDFKKHLESSLKQAEKYCDDCVKISYIFSIVDTDWIKPFKNTIRKKYFDKNFAKAFKYYFYKKLGISSSKHVYTRFHIMDAERENWSRRFGHFGIMVAIFCLIGLITIIVLWFYNHSDTFKKHERKCNEAKKSFSKSSHKHHHHHVGGSHSNSPNHSRNNTTDHGVGKRRSIEEPHDHMHHTSGGHHKSAQSQDMTDIINATMDNIELSEDHDKDITHRDTKQTHGSRGEIAVSPTPLDTNSKSDLNKNINGEFHPNHDNENHSNENTVTENTKSNESIQVLLKPNGTRQEKPIN